MKRLIQSAIAVTFCLPMAFAGCKDGCDCKKCADKDKEKTELADCKEGCDCKSCKEKAKEKASLADCDKCKKGDEKEKEGAFA
ncbi:MAG: hypothetical protein V4640_00255 [Verrucomicrobiota bacterium]